LKPKNGTPVIDQVELNIPTPTIKLEVTLAIAILSGVTPLNNGGVGRQEGVATALHKGKQIFPGATFDRAYLLAMIGCGCTILRARVRDGVQNTFRILIVKEDTTDTTSLSTMLEVEVLITPELKGGVILWMMRVTRLL